MKYTAYLALAVDVYNPKLPGVPVEVSDVIVDTPTGRLSIPVLAMACAMKEKFVDFVANRAGELYDSLKSVVEP